MAKYALTATGSGKKSAYKTFDEAMREVNQKAVRHTNSLDDDRAAMYEAVKRNEQESARRKESVAQQKEGMRRSGRKFSSERELNYEANRAASRSESAIEGEKNRKVLEDAFREEQNGGRKVRLRNAALRKKYGR